MMSTDQRQARAIQKAAEQRAHVWAMPGRPGFYTVKSATDPDEKYVVTAHGYEVVCSCKAASYGQPCWHSEKLRSRLIRESVRNSIRHYLATEPRETAAALLYA